MLTLIDQNQGIIPLTNQGFVVNGHVFHKCWAVLDNKKQFFKNRQDLKNTQEIIRFFWDCKIDPYLGGEIIDISSTSGKKDYSIIGLIGVARDDTLLRKVQNRLTPENKDITIQIRNKEFYSEPFSHFKYTDLILQHRFWLTPKKRRTLLSRASSIDITLVSEKILNYQLRAPFWGARYPMLAEYHSGDAFPNYQQEQVERHQTHFQE